MTAQLAGWLDESLARFKAHQAENAAVTPDAYVLDDARGSSFVDAERTLADRILAARVAKEKAYADRVTAEDEARLERERLEHEAAMEAAAEAARNLKIAPRAKTPPPRPKPLYPPCGYFESAEGLTSLETMKDAFENAFENPSLRRLPSPRLPRAVKVADPEPADPRSWDGAFGDHEAYIDEVYDGGEAYAHTQNTYDDRYDRYGRHVADSRHPPYAFGASTGAKPDRVRAETEYLARPEGYLYRRRETQRAHEAHAHALATDSRTSARAGKARVDYTGRRRARPAAPASLYRRDVAVSARNHRYDDVDGNSRPPVRTTSTVLASHRGGGRDRRDGTVQTFELSPAHVHFGRVSVSSGAVERRATLTNVGVDAQRFSIRQPEAHGPFRVEFRPGMVSPGLAARLRVVCDARGVPPGDYVGEAVVTTERQVFALSLSARVAAPGGGSSVDVSGRSVVDVHGGSGVHPGGEMRLDETVSLRDMRGGR